MQKKDKTYSAFLIVALLEWHWWSFVDHHNLLCVVLIESLGLMAAFRICACAIRNRNPDRHRLIKVSEDTPTRLP